MWGRIKHFNLWRKIYSLKDECWLKWKYIKIDYGFWYCYNLISTILINQAVIVKESLLSFVLLCTFIAKHAVHCIDLADVQIVTELNTAHWNICGWRCLILLVFLLHGYTYIFTGRHGGLHCGGGKNTAVLYLATGHGGLGRVVQLNQKQI